MLPFHDKDIRTNSSEAKIGERIKLIRIQRLRAIQNQTKLAGFSFSTQNEKKIIIIKLSPPANRLLGRSFQRIPSLICYWAEH